MAKPVILGYWKMRGLSEAARLMLEYTETPYEQVQYECGDDDSWLKDKSDLGLDFPNLPYLIDGDFKISESWAVYRYICAPHGLVPTDRVSLALCDMVSGVLESFVWDFIRLCYFVENFDSAKNSYIENNAGKRLARLEKFLDGKKFLIGEKLTFVDFAFFEALDQHQVLFPDIMNNFPNIKNFHERFGKLDKIASYRNSSRFRKSPIFNTIANWRG